MATKTSALPASIPPMLAKVAASLPAEGEYLFEPKWDGFRAIVFRSGGKVLIQSRELKPLDRYFPELSEALLKLLPNGCIVDGEIVVAGQTASGWSLDFDALQQRIHPAESRVLRLSKETPAAFVAFDLLAAGGKDIMALPQSDRRTRLEKLLASAQAPLHLTPMTREHKTATDWLKRFEGAGLDGVMAKPADAPYQPGKRAMFKIKHVRTADCVVAGLRWYKGHENKQDAVGSLLLGLYDDKGVLQHAGITSSFTMEMRRQLVDLLAPLRKNALKHHPWRDWGDAAVGDAQRMPGAQSRWSGGKDLSWEPLLPEKVCEVKYDHLQGNRFRHATTFVRWRDDKSAHNCRYDQLEVTPTYELKKVLGAK